MRIKHKGHQGFHKEYERLQERKADEIVRAFCEIHCFLNGESMADEITILRSNALSKQIIGAAIEVHRHFGPGLSESACENCFCRELELRGLPFERQKGMPIQYKGLHLECGYRLDVRVDGLVIVEIKAVEKIEPVHEAQLLTYLRLTGVWLGLLINFNELTLKEGIRRVVNG